MSKEELIETYVTLMKNFFDLVSKSDSMKELNFPISSLYIGINSIHRVFEYAIMKTKNIDKSIYYAQNTYYYYLEYMNQIHQSNLSQSLNHIDAVLFVYKKTIFDLSNNEQNTMNNIMTLNNHSITIDDEVCKQLFMNISNIMNTLFYFSNQQIDFYNRKTICDCYLERFLLRVNDMKLPISYLEIIQHKFTIHFTVYKELLDELLVKRRKNSKKVQKCLTESEHNTVVLMKFYVEESTFKEKFERGNTKELVQWLFG